MREASGSFAHVSSWRALDFHEDPVLHQVPVFNDLGLGRNALAEEHTRECDAPDHHAGATDDHADDDFHGEDIDSAGDQRASKRVSIRGQRPRAVGMLGSENGSAFRRSNPWVYSDRNVPL